MKQILEKTIKTAGAVGFCTLFAWIIVFASSPKKPSPDMQIAISTDAETRYVGEARGFLLDLLMDVCALSFLVAFGCTIAKGRPEKKEDEPKESVDV
jgi:hypothetical protein